MQITCHHSIKTLEYSSKIHKINIYVSLIICI